MAAFTYSNRFTASTLAQPITASSTTMRLSSTAGLPGTYPFTLVLEPDAVTMEIVTVTGLVGIDFSITRGQDGTSAQAHEAAADVKHMVVARDLAGPQAHMNNNAGVHGVTGNVVGTSDAQTLTNKIISGSNNTLSNIPDAAITGLAASKLTGAFPGFSGTTGAFSGALSAASAAISGVLSAASATFSGLMQAGQATINGALSAASAAIGGAVDAAIVRATQTVQATGTGDIVAFYSNVGSGQTAPFLEFQKNSVNKIRGLNDGTVQATDYQIIGGQSISRGVRVARKRITSMVTNIAGTDTEVFSQAVTLDQNRCYKFTVSCPVSTSQAGGFTTFIDLRANGGRVADAGVVKVETANEFSRGHIVLLLDTGTSQLTKTWSVNVRRVTGSIAYDVAPTADKPFVFVVEDMGPAGVMVES